MVAMKRRLAILLCMLMVVMMPMGALAVEEGPTLETAMDAGREVNTSVKFTWHSLPMLGEEENQLISLLLNNAELAARYTKEMEGEGSYASYALRMSGKDAMTVDYVHADGVYYFASPMLPRPMAIPEDELADVMGMLFEYLETAMESEADAYGEIDFSSFDEVFAQMQAAMDEQTAMSTVDYDSLQETYAQLGVEETMEAVSSWLAEDMQGELYEGAIGTTLDAQPAKAMVYQLTKQRLINLIDAVEPTLVNNEVYWGQIVDMVNQQSGLSGEEVTLDEVMQSLPEFFDGIKSEVGNLSDDVIMRYNECFDENDDYVLSQVEVIVPDEYDDFVFLMEWLPEGLPLYLEAMRNGSGLTLSVNKNAMPDQGISMAMDLYDYDEVMASIGLHTTSVNSTKTNGRIWDGGISLMVSDGYMTEFLIDATLNQVDDFVGDDIERMLVGHLNVQLEDESMPIATLNASVKTGEPQGYPIDISDTGAFDYPGRMTEEEFTEYMGTVSATSMQAVFGIASVLPPEIFQILMGASMN